MESPSESLDETETLTMRAQMLVDLGRPTEALLLLHRALGHTPDDDEALCLLSVAHWNLAQRDEALTWAERAVAARPEGIWAHQILACHLICMKQYPRALTVARETVRLDPENTESLNLLGHAQLESGYAVASRRTAGRMRRLAPDEYLTHELLIRIAYHQDRWPDVEKHCRDALAIDPNSYTALCYLAEALDNLSPGDVSSQPGRLPEAIDCLDRAIRIDPVDAEARDHLDRVLANYLLTLAVVRPGGSALFLLTVGSLGVHFLPTSRIFCEFVCVFGGLRLGRVLRTMRTSRRRFRALSASTQQFWRQGWVNLLGVRLPWN